MKVHLILLLATTVAFDLSQAAFLFSSGLEHPKTKECLAMTNVPKEDIENFDKDWRAPTNRNVKCSLAYCLIIDKKAIKKGNSSINYDYMQLELNPNNLKKYLPPKGVDDFMSCAKPPAVVDFCDNAFDLMVCILKNKKRYYSPLTESDDEVVLKCENADTIDGDKLPGTPKAERGKCMAACYLREMGGITKDGKLDVPYLSKKIIDDLPKSLTTRRPESVEDFKKCSPNATDPTGSKNVCEGAQDFFTCMVTTSEKYDPNASKTS